MRLSVGARMVGLEEEPYSCSLYELGCGARGRGPRSVGGRPTDRPRRGRFSKSDRQQLWN
eukprot:4133642-Prymnesium_polylepis.2